MNAAVQTLPHAAQKAVPMEVLIRGRVDAITRHDGKTKTRVLTPAADAYSRPQVVDIRSERKIGERGEEITVSCRLGGYTRKAFRVVDKDTGETSMVTPVDMTLDAIE